MRIRKNDQVLVIAGKDRGKKGRVMKVYPTQAAVLVEKINYRKKASRPTKENPKGGLIQMETPIHISNVQLLCPKTGKPTKVGYVILKDGEKQRIAKKSQEMFGDKV
ncbi:MAG: 50S ribosomal protein L24 [Candidatus Omnitrophica bacterium]|nr:50S ribosomal protein L24 [Candidatus Omnitrophota bacterium]